MRQPRRLPGPARDHLRMVHEARVPGVVSDAGRSDLQLAEAEVDASEDHPAGRGATGHFHL